MAGENYPLAGENYKNKVDLFLGLVTKLLNLISEITLQGQMAKLQQGQAIGNEKHQRQLIDLITEQRLLLAESLFCLACQTPLSKMETLKLLSHLKKCMPNEDTGEIDQVDMFVFFALLYCLNASSLEKQLRTGELYHKNFITQSLVVKIYSKSHYPTYR